MPVEPHEIERLIREAFPEAQIEVVDTVGDRNHYAARIVTPEFRGKNRVQQQRMVNRALSPILDGPTAPLHAIALTTAAPD